MDDELMNNNPVKLTHRRSR